VRLLKICLALAALAPAVAHAEWVKLPFPRGDVSLRAIAAAGANEVHVGGSKGTYGISRDGGKTWRMASVPDSADLDFRGLAVPSAGTTVLMSAGPGQDGKARLFRTEDGGTTWAVAYETRQAGAFFDSIAFRDTRTGFVMGDPVGGAYQVFATHDGGKTWAQVKAKLPPMQKGEAAFAASNSALGVGPGKLAWMVTGGAEHARVFASRDDGRTWSVTDAPVAAGATAGLFGVAFADALHGTAVGGDHKDETRASPNIVITSDGGRTWRRAAHEGPSGLKEGIGRLNAKTLLTVGPRGTSISKDGGATWKAVDEVAHHAISCAGGTCYAAGANGRVSVWR
jgi:photosystem II stability/assembly factor-like uncharacterized protein